MEDVLAARFRRIRRTGFPNLLMSPSLATEAPETGGPGLPDLPGGWRDEGERIRFVQFSFERD